MNSNQNKNDGTMEEKDMLKDALTAQKLMAANYSTFAGECSTKSLREDMLNIFREEHDIQQDIFMEMHTRGWYPTPLAEPQKVQQANQKYSNPQQQ